MRAISLQQPWASLMARGQKRYETRKWATGYRGPLAIHASQTYPPHCRECAQLPAFRDALADAGPMPLGCFLAIGYLDHCRLIRPSTHDAVGCPENEFGDYTPGRYLFEIVDVRPLVRPIPYKGALSLWVVPDTVAIRLQALAA